MFRPKSSRILLAFCILFCSCVHGGKALFREDAFRAYYRGRGILEREGAGGESRAWPLFEIALASANSRVAEAAAAELILPLLRGGLDAAAFLEGRNKYSRKIGNQAALPLRTAAAAALYRLGRWEETALLFGTGAAVPGKGPPAGREAAGTGELLDSWGRVLLSLARQRLALETEEQESSRMAESPRPPAMEALLSCLFEIPPGPPLRWAAEEIDIGFPDFLNEAEEAALKGRLAAARSSFAEGLALFRPALEEDPGLFLRYPALISDLGRCFQFGAAGDEGIETFLAWEKEGAAPVPRYQLLYYAGRIARSRGSYDQGAGLFERALAAAPDPIQEDACLWYILDTRLRESGEGLSGPELVKLVKTWMPRRRDPAYFDDILDRVAQRLASSGQWRFFPELLAFLEQYGAPLSIARYAYISGRALSVGLMPGEGPGFGGKEAREEEARRLFRTAYRTGTRALYYRAMGAYFLGESFIYPEEETRTRNRNFPHREEMEFLLGFYKAGLPNAGEPYMEALAGELTLDELRALGEAMEKAGAHAQAIRTASRWINREDYEIQRRDLEILAPRPFQELIEEGARRTDFPPELLYGLVRTESAFQPEIISRAGAVGLTQLMPATAADMAGRMKRGGGPDYTGNLDLKDPEINTGIGFYYLNYLRDLLNHPLSAILAYNGGLGRVRRWRQAQDGLPGDLFLETIEYPETREYGRRIISAAALYGYLYYGVNPPPFLADICK
ncbi:MAG: lytic transglycosylase domain-containing protein [Treponema sp.]|nr:lytic transglycosylase domain-containing protein [Treponema sp.]